MPLEAAHLAARGQVPEPHHAVGGAAADRVLAVGGDGHGPVGAIVKPSYFPAGLDVPDTHGLVGAGGDDVAAVREELHAPDAVFVAVEAEVFAVAEFPQAHGAVGAAGQGTAAVRLQCRAQHGANVARSRLRYVALLVG